MSRIIIRKDNLYGVMNELGEIIIEPSYERMRNFSNGLAAVCKGDKWGYIDHRGNQTIDFLYDDAKDFSVHGVAAVKLNHNANSWTLIKNNNELIKPPTGDKYYDIGEFNAYGYAIVKTYSGYHIIDKDGNSVSNEEYSSLVYMEDQEVFIGDKIGNLCLINTEGEAIIDPEYDYDEIYYPSNGLCQVGKNNKSGYINMEGELVIPLKYENGYEFAKNGLAYVSYDNGLGGYINKNDEFVIQPIFESGTVFECGRAAVSKGGRYIFIDEQGLKAINGAFKYAGGFSECGLAKIELFDGRKGFIRPDGVVQFMLKQDWDAEEFIGNKKITQLKIGDKIGLMNHFGKVILQPCYEEIILSIDANLHPFRKDGLWGYLDDHGNVVMKNIYEEASTFTEHHSAFVEFYSQQKDEIIGFYINSRGEIIDDRLMEMFYLSFSEKYSKLYGFNEGLALAEKKEKTKILNCYGKEIITEDFNLSLKHNTLFIHAKKCEVCNKDMNEDETSPFC